MLFIERLLFDELAITDQIVITCISIDAQKPNLISGIKLIYKPNIFFFSAFSSDLGIKMIDSPSSINLLSYSTFSIEENINFISNVKQTF